MRWGVFVLLSLVCRGALWADFKFHFDTGDRSWSLNNATAEAGFRLSPAGHFEFLEFFDTRTGEGWGPARTFRSSPIQLRVEDRTYDAYTPFRLVEHSSRAIGRGGYRQTIVLEDLEGRGRVTVDLDMYEGHPALRYRVRFRNLRSTTVRVRSADLLPWAFHDRGERFRAFRVNQWVKAGKEGNFEPLDTELAPDGMMIRLDTGAHGQHCAWLALRDTVGRGLFAGWEFDGRATVTVRQPAAFGFVQLTGSITDLHRPVAPNAEFVLPWAFVGLFRGDWDEAAYRTQRFAEQAIARPLPDRNFPYVIWDSWKYQTGIDEWTLRRNAEIADKLGIEAFVIDLGWARQIGDWHADPAKFPSGLRALSDYVHSLGMKFGLHFPLAEAMSAAPVLRANPDWTSSESYGYFDARSLCLSHRPVRDWIVGEAVRMIDDYNVDWILQDGENMVKECTKKTHTHDPADSNYSNAVDGLNAVVTTIQARRPRVVWENCEDGGNMMTYNMMRRYATSIAADDSGPLTTRQAIYGITYPFSPRYADRYMPDEQLSPYITRSYMFGGPWIFMNKLPEMRQQDTDLAASEIRLFKSLRARIRDGKVFHLGGRPSETTTDAIESYHEATDSAIVFLSRAQSPAPRRIRLKGLRPEGAYRVRYQEDQAILRMSGAELMQRGAPVTMGSWWSSEIVYVEAIPGGGNQ